MIQFPSKRTILIFIAGLSLLFSGAAAAPIQAQEELLPQNERPFQLPFVEPPSPDTWLMGQPYGNTTGAYRRRFTTYGASGGIHFGLDFAAPCRTEIVAIADGVVFAVDGPFGSPPHNLMIDHPQLGYASMYGHLLEPPNLRPGQQVKQGEVIALVGDSAETCYNRPHLHLEIRDLAHIRKFNPQPLIDADWNNLALIGDSGREFARDLDEPRKWQSLYDQPEVRTAGPIVNDFANPWPIDWEKSIAPTADQVIPARVSIPAATATAVSPDSSPTVGRQITVGDCCTNPTWSDDSSQIRFIDQPNSDAPLGVWGIDVSAPLPRPEFVTGWLGRYSPDETLIAYPNPDTGMAVIERLSDGKTWEIDTQENSVNFAPDGRRVMWSVEDESTSRDNRLETIWAANVDGTDKRILLSARRIDRIGWLSAEELLLSQRIPGASDETFRTLSVVDGSLTELVTVPEPRGATISPDGRYVVYYTRSEPDPSQNGLWLLDLEAETLTPQKLPFFGSYRWRDSNRLIYVPFDPDAVEHNFYEYHVLTGKSWPLFPNGTNITIANNDWRVSPDGTKIVLVEANGAALNGIWVLEIE